MSRTVSRTTMKFTSVRLNIHLADEAVKALGAKSRTEAVHVALRTVVGPKRYTVLEKERAH